MVEPSLSARLRSLVSQHTGAPESSLGPTSTPKNTPGWDSVANLSLVESIEEEFGVTITTRDAMALRSLGDIEAYLGRARTGRKP